MTLLSIPAVAELLDDSERHVLALGEAGELKLVDIAHHAKNGGTVTGADGKRYPRRKRRLKVTAESVRQFIAGRTIGQEQPRRRRRQPEAIIEFF